MRRRECKARAPDLLRSRSAGPLSGPPAGFPGRPLAGSLPVALLLTSLGIGAFGGCSSPVLGSRVAAEPAAEPTSTGSIGKPPTSFGDDLGEEDWRRAHAALGVALDPQGNGRPVRWDNPETGMRGSVNPTGLPYVADDEICRDFLASVVSPRASRFLHGTGCKPSGGAWALKRLRKAKGPAKNLGNGSGKDTVGRPAAPQPARA